MFLATAGESRFVVAQRRSLSVPDDRPVVTERDVGWMVGLALAIVACVIIFTIVRH